MSTATQLYEQAGSASILLRGLPTTCVRDGVFGGCFCSMRRVLRSTTPADGCQSDGTDGAAPLSGFAVDCTGRALDLRLNWAEVKQKLARGSGGGNEGLKRVDETVVLADFPLEALDPTQRAFADRVLAWARELVSVYKEVARTVACTDPLFWKCCVRFVPLLERGAVAALTQQQY